MANNILEMALERLERDFPPSSLSAWFDDATVVSFTDNRLVLHSPVQFKKEFIDHKFIEPLQNALYELTGDVPNVTFPCAALADSETGRIAIYYGCADTVTGLAFTTVDELLNYMKEHPLEIK